MKTFNELKAELLQNPEVRAEYERLLLQHSADEIDGCWRCKRAVFGPGNDPDFALYSGDVVKQVHSALACLTPCETKVLRMRFGIDMPAHTYEEAGKKLDVTRERIRQFEAKAIRKLRHYSRKAIWESA